MTSIVNIEGEETTRIEEEMAVNIEVKPLRNYGEQTGEMNRSRWVSTVFLIWQVNQTTEMLKQGLPDTQHVFMYISSYALMMALILTLVLNHSNFKFSIMVEKILTGVWIFTSNLALLPLMAMSNFPRIVYVLVGFVSLGVFVNTYYQVMPPGKKIYENWQRMIKGLRMNKNLGSRLDRVSACAELDPQTQGLSLSMPSSPISNRITASLDAHVGITLTDDQPIHIPSRRHPIGPEIAKQNGKGIAADLEEGMMSENGKATLLQESKRTLDQMEIGSLVASSDEVKDCLKNVKECKEMINRLELKVERIATGFNGGQDCLKIQKEGKEKQEHACAMKLQMKDESHYLEEERKLAMK